MLQQSEFANYMRKMRSVNLMHQRELAEKLGMKNTAVSQIERGARFPSYLMRRRLFVVARDLGFKPKKTDFFDLTVEVAP